MGNTYQNSISPTLLQFQIVHTHPLDYYKEIKHKKNGQSLLVKQIIPVNNEHSNDIKTIIEAKMINKSSFITQLVYWERPVSSQLCSRSQSFMLLFNNAGITLTEYIKKRQRSFSTQELSNILQQTLKGLKYYNIVHHVHNQINSDCIFYNGQRAILIDPWLTSNNDLNQKHPLNRRSIYRSPQKQLYQRDEIQSYDQSKSNIYQLGLLIIDLATNGKYSEQYNQISSKRESISKQKVNRVNIGAILEGIEDFKLKSKLNVLINPNPDKRLTIFNIMLPQRITLKQFNSAHKNSNFKNLPHSRFYTDCTQNSNKKPPKSLKKSKNQPIKNNSDLRINSNQKKLVLAPQKKQQVTPQKCIYQRYFHNQNSFKYHSVEKSNQKIQRNKSLNTTPAGSTFTYAQWLPTYTQSNETGVYSKKQSKEETSSNANSIYYHQPHKILKIVQSNNTSVNSSFIKEPDKSPNKFGFSYHSQDNPNQSFINFLQKNNDNHRNRQRKDQNQDKQDDNLNIIEEQMNSYVTSYSPVIGSIPLSREDSKIRLSQNPSYSNLSPNRNNNRSNYQRVNKHSVQSTPQKIISPQRVLKTPLRQNINVRFHVSNPSPPHAHPIISKQHQQLNNQVINLPKPIKLSPGNNIFCTPQDLSSLNHMQQHNTNYQLGNHPAIHPIVQKQITKTDSNKINDQVGIQKLQSKTSKSSSKSSPPTPYFHRKLFPFQSFGSKQRTSPNEIQIQYLKQDLNIQSQGKKIIRQINTQEQDWEANMHKKTETIQSVEGDSQQGNQIRQVEQEYQQQKNYQKKGSKKQLQKKVSLKKLAQAQKQTQQIQQNKSKSSKSRKSYIKIVTPDKKKSIQQYQINITLSNDEDSGEDREKTNNIPSQVHTNKKQKRGHRNQYTSDLGSAKQTESIIFDSEQKKNSRLRRNRKQDHQSLHNSIQRNNLRKNISFGSQQTTIKQKKSELNINNNRILEKQPENNAKAKQESDFIKKIISMTKIQTQKANFDNIQKIDKKLHELSLLARDKQEQNVKKQAKIIKKTSQPMNNHKSFNNVSVTNTLPMPIRNLKPLLENQGGKLAISIETDPLASIESVVDSNYGSSLFGRLKGFDKSNGSSPYLKNKKGLNMSKIQEKNVKIQQQLQSAIIGDQLGYSQDYNKVINKSATKNIKKLTSGQSSHAADSLMMIGSQFRVPFKTQNSIINKLNQENINSQRTSKESAIHNENNQYNNQSNQSLKYYVIEKYPFPGKAQIFQKYQGYKWNGVRDGFGTYYYANGDIYHGEWKNDRHHGHGGIYRRKKNLGSKSQDSSVINQSIIHNRQQYYDTICEGIWDNGNFLPNIDTNSNQSNKNSSNPISPPSSANILSSSSPDKYKTSIINLLPVPLPIHTSYQDSSFLSKKSLNKQTSIVNSYNFSDLSRNQQLSSCSIGKNQRILDFNPLNQIITLKNGDLFKGIAITNLDSDAQMKIQGKLMKKNGQIVQGVWLYKDKQLFDIE